MIFEESVEVYIGGLTHHWQADALNLNRIICQRRSGPYLTTVQTSCQSNDLEKPQQSLAVTSSVNSGNGRPEVVSCLLSSCVHASITSKSESKVFELSDKFRRYAIVREGGNHRNIPAEENHVVIVQKKTMQAVKGTPHIN